MRSHLTGQIPAGTLGGSPGESRATGRVQAVALVASAIQEQTEGQGTEARPGMGYPAGRCNRLLDPQDGSPEA